MGTDTSPPHIPGPLVAPLGLALVLGLGVLEGVHRVVVPGPGPHRDPQGGKVHSRDPSTVVQRNLVVGWGQGLPDAHDTSPSIPNPPPCHA
jgi:hypothetical protein